MSDTTVTTAAPVAAPSTGPVITEAQYHPDHPGPVGWLIFELHERLLAVEGKLGLATPPKAAVTVTAPATPAVAVAPAPVAAPTEGIVATAETDVEAALHKVEDLLHIKHS